MPYKYKEIWKIIDKKASQKVYDKQSIANVERNRVLVVGAGPCGLRFFLS